MAGLVAEAKQSRSEDGRMLLAGVKALLHFVALILVLPLWISYRVLTLAVPSRRNQIFQTFSQLLSLIPGIPGVVARRAFYILVLEKCSSNVTISFGTVLSTPEAEIGQSVYIGAYCTLGTVSLGEDVLLGSNVDIMSGTRQHHIDRLDVPIRSQGGTFTRVRVGRDVWIGNGAIVAADVGEQAIVAAGAVVVKAVGPRSIVAGNPARQIGERGQGKRDPDANAPLQGTGEPAGS